MQLHMVRLQGLQYQYEEANGWNCWILDFEGEIAEKQSEGFATDFRICIDSSYCFVNEDPKSIYVLSVQVGDGVLDEDGSDLLLPLNFQLSVPTGSPKFWQNFRVGRYNADPNLASDANFNLAFHWWRECCEEHPSCPVLAEMPPLPTRVIDVKLGPDQVCLVHAKGLQGSHTALSHCWGGEAPLKLLASNVSKFSQGIALESLPANFRDAIMIPRQLDIRYIWIDSLCIIQDSVTDWEDESKKMGDIYHKATLVIAAAAAENTSDGILKTYIPKFKDSRIRIRASPNSPPQDGVWLSRKDEEE